MSILGELVLYIIHIYLHYIICIDELISFGIY